MIFFTGYVSNSHILNVFFFTLNHLCITVKKKKKDTKILIILHDKVKHVHILRQEGFFFFF